MNDIVSEMLVFSRIAEAGSLSGAARQMGMSLPVVSRKLARMEDRLGVRLANRTTRRLVLTEEGSRYYERCSRILTDLQDAEREVTSGRDVAVGLLRVTAPYEFGMRWLSPLLLEFQDMHPLLHIHLQTSDSLSNLVGEGFDLAVRIGGLTDSRLITRQLAANEKILCASPAYLDRRGRPRSIDDLADHEGILFGEPPSGQWTFLDGSTVAMRSRLSTNTGELAHRWALQGRGLVMKSLWDVHDDIRHGRLEVVLPEERLADAPIHALFPHGRLAPAKVRLCLEFLARRMRELASEAHASLLQTKASPARSSRMAKHD